MFSYLEHEWSSGVDCLEEAVEELMSVVAENDWTPHTGSEPDPADIPTIEELEERALAAVADWGVPEDAVRVPIGKLRVVVNEGGWTFVAGGFMAAEPNHNDTEFTAKLTR